MWFCPKCNLKQINPGGHLNHIEREHPDYYKWYLEYGKGTRDVLCTSAGNV